VGHFRILSLAAGYWWGLVGSEDEFFMNGFIAGSSGVCGWDAGRDEGCHSNVMVDMIKSGSSEG
jgi:hypothetical protein